MVADRRSRFVRALASMTGPAVVRSVHYVCIRLERTLGASDAVDPLVRARPGRDGSQASSVLDIDTLSSGKARHGALDSCVASTAHALIALLRTGENVRRRKLRPPGVERWGGCILDA
jgi:hypothetical protein